MNYTLKDPKPMGDNDPKYGQIWWSQTHDSDKPVMFNLMSGTVGDGAVISFEESINKQSAKGTDYLRLRKVKIESSGVTHGSAPPNDSSKLLTLIYEDTQKILKLVDTSGYDKAKVVAASLPRDTVVEDIGEEPINIDDIPF